MKFKLFKFSRVISLVLLLLLMSLVFFSIAPQGVLGQGDSSVPEASLSPVSGTDYITTRQGKTAVYSLILKNQGTQKESFIINIESPYSWEVDVSPQTGVGLDAGDTEEIRISFQIPESLRKDDYQFDVVVKSRGFNAGQTTIHVVVSDKEVIITAALKPILIIKSSKEDLGRLSPGQRIDIEVEVKCYVLSAEVYLEHRLFKIMGSGLSAERNLTVSLEPENKYISKGKSFVFTLTIEFPKEFNTRANYNCQLQLMAKAAGHEPITNPVILSFVIAHEPDRNLLISILENPLAMVGISTMILVGVIGAAISSHEAGKFWFLSALFLPLYTKLHKNKILDHFTRGRVYEYIRNNPGVHYSEIKRELELNNGNLTYHLHTLAREELIKSRVNGRFKVFFPTDVKIPADMEPQITSFRKRILEIIRHHPGISQKELGLKLPTKKQRTISYHIKTMSREGVIRLEKDGRETKCYIRDKIIDIKQDIGVDEKISETEEYSHRHLDKDSILRQI